MGGKKYTLDTNILIYSIDNQAGKRHKHAVAIMEHMFQCDCVLTIQALSEFYSAATRKDKMLKEDAKAQVIDWMMLFPVVGSIPRVLEQAMQAVEEHHLSFWDAMLLETAVHAGVDLFLTEDMQHKRLWKSMRIQNPFTDDFRVWD